MDKQKIQEKLLDDPANVVRSGPEAIATASGVLLGAMTGALAGPAGAIAGAFVGGVVGLVTGAVSEDERQEQEARTRDQQRERNDAVPSDQRITLPLFFNPRSHHSCPLKPAPPPTPSSPRSSAIPTNRPPRSAPSGPPRAS